MRQEFAEALRQRMQSEFRAANPGRTQDGNELWRRSIAPWDDGAWADVSPALAEIASAGLVRVGVHALDPGSGAGRAAQDAALVPLVGRGNLVLYPDAAGMTRANEVLQSVALRVVSSVRPGRVRVIGIDAGGLGQNLAACLHLPELVRGPRVWHEEAAIADGIAELRMQLSTVVQQYLKNDYATIDDYCRAAGETAVPYRLLVVAGFPAGFREKTAEDLLAIASIGSRVGAHLVMSVDPQRRLPQRTSFAELLGLGTLVYGSGGTFWWIEAWEQPALGQPGHPGTEVHGAMIRSLGVVELDPAPPRALVQALASALAPVAESHAHTKVPFDELLPVKPWSGKTVDGLRAPIGRHVAREPFFFELGRAGTAHHALLGGQTGSGKTNLLHVLITNLALHYAPSELELYIVDFKEGVEFQDYRDLPHARVVAIESEREFGLSVVQALVREIRRRGDLFRDAGCGNLGDWRRKTGGPLSRVLLVVDEFQRFFERADRLASSARVVLDQLVREGRAFGVHVLLASQTLSGVDIEPSTLSQIGVRIALKSSDSDSERLLGRGNVEAALLVREGEAIYNPDLGHVDRNTRVQVAYLPREQRERILGQVRALVTPEEPGRVPVVFEGNRPAKLSRSDRFRQWFATTPSAVPRAYDVVLGEPTTLDDGPAGYRMRRQSCGNLLLVGNDESAAQRAVCIAVAGIALQLPRGEGLVRIVNLANVDDPLHEGFDLLEHAPVPVEFVDRAAVRLAIDGAHDELEQRLAALASAGRARRASIEAPQFLVLFGAQRARDLQRDGLRAAEAARKLGELLRRGPDVGLHTIAWFDTYASVLRVFEPGGLVEWGGRVALTGGDAMRLFGAVGANLAPPRPNYLMLAREESSDEPERIHGYGPDSVAWLAQELAQSAARGWGGETA